jgi:hypothetical protein
VYPLQPNRQTRESEFWKGRKPLLQLTSIQDLQHGSLEKFESFWEISIHEEWFFKGMTATYRELGVMNTGWYSTCT